MAILVFDVNETLSDMAPLAHELARHGASEQLAATWFASVLRDGFALSLHGRAPAFLDLAAEVLRGLLSGGPSEPDDVGAVVDAALAAFRTLDVHPDVPEAFRELADAGHTLATFTNGSVGNTQALLARAGIEQHVAHVLSVEQLAVWKPAPAAYLWAAEQLAAPPSALTMVAVHPWDLDGAHRAGLRTAFVNRSGAPWPASFAAPGLEVATMRGLLPALGTSGQEAPR